MNKISKADLARYRLATHTACDRIFNELRTFEERLPELIPGAVFLDTCELLARHHLPSADYGYHDQIAAEGALLQDPGSPRARGPNCSVAPLAVLEFLGLLKPKLKLIDGVVQVTIRDFEYWRVLAGPLVQGPEDLLSDEVSANELLHLAVTLMLARNDFQQAIPTDCLFERSRLAECLAEKLRSRRLDLNPPLEAMTFGNRPFGHRVECFYARGDLRKAAASSLHLAAALGRAGVDQERLPGNVMRRALSGTDTIDLDAGVAELRDLGLDPGLLGLDIEQGKDFQRVLRGKRNHLRNMMYRWEYETIRRPKRFGLRAHPDLTQDQAFTALDRVLEPAGLTMERSTLKRIIYEGVEGVFSPEPREA